MICLVQETGGRFNLTAKNMKAPCNPQVGFQALKTRSMYSVAIANFASVPIVPNNVLNILMTAILATGVFQLEYTKWYACV